MQTPNTVDMYSRFMDELFDEKEVVAVSTVYQQFFGKSAFGGSKTIYSPDSDVVEIDIMRANERIAALIHRDTNGEFLNLKRNTLTQNYSSFSRLYPLAEEIGNITASQINKRVGGENPYERRSKIDRMRMLAREHHMEHIRRYVRLFEVLAGQSLLGGMQASILGSANTGNWYDFNRNAGLLVSPAIPWDQAGANILGDIDDGCDQLRILGHVRPNVMFMAGDVCNVFLRDTTIQAMADIKGYNLVRAGEGQFNLPGSLSDLVAAGADAIGRLTTPKGRTIYLFSYDAVVTDDNGAAQNLLPDGIVFLAFYGARCDRYFGPAERLPIISSDLAFYQETFGMNMATPVIPSNIKNVGGVVTPQMFYCDAYRAEDNKKIAIRTQSAPIFATTQTDSFYTMSNVLTRSS
jgi:hypothetical protein